MQFFDQAGVVALGSRLRRIGEILATDAAALFTEYGVSLDTRWFPVFYTLAGKQEAGITELASDVGQSHAAVSQVVSQMLEAGLVTRRRSETDSRRNLVCLTSHGHEVAERLFRQCKDVETAVSSMLDSIDADLWQGILGIEQELSERSLALRVRAARKARESADIEIVDFAPVHAAAFRALNLAWIREHWEPEAADFKALDHPQTQILDTGGHIVIALRDGEVVGTCALLKMDDATYELAKMAVAPATKGMGVGERLGKAVIAQARRRGARQLYLESNTVLEPAINLYRKLGFERIPQRASPYARSNIQMMLEL